MKSTKKSTKRSAPPTAAAAVPVKKPATKAPTKAAPAVESAPAPRRRSLLATAVAKVKAVVRRTARKPKAITPAAELPETPVKSKPALRPAVRPAARAVSPSVELPASLLEGDEPKSQRAGGPGQRFSLGPVAPVETATPEPGLGELPAAYGTGRLLLVARDPHWLYAAWDLTDDQLRTHNRAARGGHLIVRVFENDFAAAPTAEAKVHPESRTWFIHVGKAGAKFVAELGYYAKKDGTWVGVSQSKATLTPPDSLSEDTSARFSTIPVELSFPQMLALIKEVLKSSVPLAEAVQQLRLTGARNLPDINAIESRNWTAQQENAMREIINMDAVRRVWIGSLEVTELLRRELLKEVSSMSATQLGRASSFNVSSLGSALGGRPDRKGFWFNVNAELILYGATEPDATVTIGGRAIKLRADGSFSYRFALPDGEYNLPAIATSAGGDDTRIADLAFRRATEYSGEVQPHPQDAALRAPRAEHVG